MIRTQIYIPEKMYTSLNRLAQERGEPMAKVTRELLEKGLEEVAQKDTSGKEALNRLLELKAYGGPKDLSSRHDYYLYVADAPKKQKKNSSR